MFQILSRLFSFRRHHRLIFAVLAAAFIVVPAAIAIGGASRKIRVMPLGDSITGSFAQMASYRFWLWQQLVSAGYGDKVEFVGKRCGTGDNDMDCGQPLYDCSVWSCRHNGYHDKTISDMLGRMPMLIQRDTADVVMIHLGTNDIIYQDAPTLEVSMENYGAIIDTIRNVNPHATILICKIIPAALSASQTDSLLKLNSLIGQLASEKTMPTSPVILVDQYTGFSGSDLQPDGFHPTQSGEKKIANKFFAALLPVLNSLNGISAHLVGLPHDAQIATGAPITLNASAYAYPCIADVVFMSDTTVLGHASMISDSTYSLTLDHATAGFYNVKAVACDFSGRTDTSASVLLVAAVNNSVMPLTIAQIRGPGPLSPNGGVLAQTTGIVTSIQKDSCGFWMQDTVRDNTFQVSSGLYISMNKSVAMPNRGDLVLVRGVIQNYQPQSTYIPQTRLACVDSIAVLGAHNALPAPLFITSTFGGAMDVTTLMNQYPGVAGMLLHFDATAIVSPSGCPAFIAAGNMSPGSGFYLSTRVAAIESRGGRAVDYNPEVLLLGSKIIDLPQVRAQDTLWSLAGVLDYDKGWLSVNPIADSLRVSHTSKPAGPVSSRGSSGGSLRITAFDLGGMFDTMDTWGKNDKVSTAAAYKTVLTKTAKAISGELLFPGILCAQNVENSRVIADLASLTNTTVGGKYKVASARKYMGFSVDTPVTADPAGLINGFLYDTTQFSLDSVKLMTGPSIDSAFGVYSPLPCSEPIVGFFRVSGVQLVVVNVRLSDKTIDDPYYCYSWPFGGLTKQFRRMQAHAVRNWINRKLALAPSALMLVAGEFNDFSFPEPSDSVEYPVGIVAGNAAKGETVFYSAYDYLQPDARYTCIQNGRGQMTEQILVDPALATYVKGLDVLHFNANYEDSFVSDSTTAIRCSSHDPVEIRF